MTLDERLAALKQRERASETPKSPLTPVPRESAAISQMRLRFSINAVLLLYLSLSMQTQILVQAIYILSLFKVPSFNAFESTGLCEPALLRL